MFVWLVIISVMFWWALFRLRRRRMYEIVSRLPLSGRELPFIGIAHTMVGDSENSMEIVRSFSYVLNEKGGVAHSWLGPVLLIGMTDPVDLEYFMKTCLDKSDLHKFTRSLTGNGLIFAPVAIWRRRRKVILPTFSPKIVESFVKVFSERSQKLTQILERHVGKGPVKMWPFLSTYTLDSVSETTMGVKINSQDDLDTPFLIAMNNILHLVCSRFFHIWMYPDWVYRLLPQYQEFQNALKTLCDFTHQVIQKKRLEMDKEAESKTESDQNGVCSNKAKTFLDHLIIMSGGKDAGFSDLELREELLTLAIAGTDTSAVATGFTMVLLAKYPDIQEKVYQELYKIYGDSDRPLVKDDLIQMKYLDRVVKESLRLFPPVPVIVRQTDGEVTLPSGRMLPARGIVVISIWGIHRDPKYWGPNAEEFDPDRFSPERYNLKHACSFMPFSNGPRNCVGYQYALFSIKTALSGIIRRYKIVGEVEQSPIPKIRTKLDLMMKAVDEYTVALERRKPR